MIRTEIRVFFTALMFFTRIPCPSWVDHTEEYLQKSSRYFPLVGWIVGLVAALAYTAATLLGAKPLLALTLSTAATILTTGAFHEDGFADMCDGFGGGWTKERILTIMQDSRLGTFGALGLALLVATKILALEQLASEKFVVEKFALEKSASGHLVVHHHAYHFGMMGAVMLAAHALSRFVAVTFLVTHRYAYDDTPQHHTKAKPLATRMSTLELSTACAFGCVPFAALVVVLAQAEPLYWWLVLAVLPQIALKWWLGRFFTRWIGGYTGDCLGATQQLSEALFYCTLLGIISIVAT
jgi:adenosylcobinamide-GDP ribazoletransferase